MPEDHCGDENVGSPTGYRIKVFSRPFLDYPVPINSLPLHQDSDPGDKSLYTFRWTNKDVVLPCNWDWLKTAALQYETASSTGRGMAVDTEVVSTLSFAAKRFSNAGIDSAGRTLIEPRDLTWCHHVQSDIPTMWGMQATCYEKISFCQFGIRKNLSRLATTRCRT